MHMNGHRWVLALVIVSLIVGVLLVAFKAQSAPPEICADTAAMVAVLKSQHQETEAAYGLMPSGRLLRVFLSRDGDWTVLFSSPEGLSCLIANGVNWSVVAEKGRVL